MTVCLFLRITGCRNQDPVRAVRKSLLAHTTGYRLVEHWMSSTSIKQEKRQQSRRWMTSVEGNGINDDRSGNIGGRNDDGSSLAMRESYKETSGNQYSAHLGCQDMLVGCAKRLRENRSFSNAGNQWTIADLGSADGSNSIRTIEVFLAELWNADFCSTGAKSRKTKESKPNINDTSSNVHIVFEEHPSSNKARLTKTVSSWLKTRNNKASMKGITYDVLMKSFYEPLFKANSVDFCMSYICLHWLDSTDTSGNGGIRDWKLLHLDENEMAVKGASTLGDFLHVSERQAPPELKALWKKDLADCHLARFLTLRARELKPEAELLLVMVSDPHEYWRPERSEESPLLMAMKRCVAEGTLRPQVLERTIVPYYLRQPQDVLDALTLAKERRYNDLGAPIHSLELLELRQYETMTGGIDREVGDEMKGARDLFWAIHGGAVVHTGGATEDEVAVIKNRLVESFDESYDPTAGSVKGTFVACIFRKKTQCGQ